MKHSAKHVRPSTGRWAVISWLLAAVFFGVSFVTALNDSAFAWLIWFVLFIVWTYIAVNATVQHFKYRKTSSS